MDGRFFHCATPSVAGWLDRADRRLVACLASVDHLTFQELFYRLVARWLADRATPAIHAGAVGMNGDAVIVTGPGGAGKSTASLACLFAGFTYLGDDFVAISRESPSAFAVHSVFSTSRLDRHDLRRFPALPDRAVWWRGTDEEKATILVAGVFPERLARVARVRAIVLPRVTASAVTRLREATRSEALLAFAPASLIQRPAATPDAFRVMAALAESVPAYWLDMATDVSTIPLAILPLLSGHP